MLAETLMIAALLAATPGFPAPEPTRGSRVAPSHPVRQAGEDIVVTGARLRATKIDYRQRGPRITYCGPRDERQDARSVAIICDFLETCALGGARAPGPLADCVEAKIAARSRRRD